MSKKNKPNELYITRIYDAPVKMVWDAWVDPKQVAKWWGPRGFTITTVSKDVKPGGRWIYTMHGPDGTDYPNNTLFHEVEKYSKLVYDHGANEHQPPLFKVTVLFSETNGKTKMDMTMALATAEAAQGAKKFIKQAGGESTWDRLAEFLSENLTSVDRFVINRSFEAPINVVYDAWTNPEHLQKWVPPTGFTMKYIKPDVRVGGSAFYSMSNSEGLTMYGKANYMEMTKPNRIVYTQIFCDKDEKISRHPMAPTWPETMLTTVTLSEEGENQTRVTITWEVYGEATAIERETFHSAKAGMTQGWSGSFEKLEQYLKT